MGGVVPPTHTAGNLQSLAASLREANQTLREIRDAIQAADRRNLKSLDINDAARGGRRLCETETD